MTAYTFGLLGLESIIYLHLAPPFCLDKRATRITTSPAKPLLTIYLPVYSESTATTHSTAHSFSASHLVLYHYTFKMGYLFYSITFLFLVSATGTLRTILSLCFATLTPPSSALPNQTPLDRPRPANSVPHGSRPHPRTPLAPLTVAPTSEPFRPKRLHFARSKQFRRRHRGRLQ